MRENNILTPLRRPLADFSKAALVMSLKAEVRAPDAAKPARKDCRIHEKNIHEAIKSTQLIGMRAKVVKEMKKHTLDYKGLLA